MEGDPTSYEEAMGGPNSSKWLILLVDVGDQRSFCMVNDQPIGNPKRKV
jgi:hypothetical protein